MSTKGYSSSSDDPDMRNIKKHAMRFESNIKDRTSPSRKASRERDDESNVNNTTANMNNITLD